MALENEKCRYNCTVMTSWATAGKHQEKQNFLIRMLELKAVWGRKIQVLDKRKYFSWWMVGEMTNFQGEVLWTRLPWQGPPETHRHSYLEAHHDLIFTRKMACERGSQNIICLPILILASFILSPRAFASENLEEKKKKKWELNLFCSS